MLRCIQTYICEKINDFEPDPKHKGNEEFELKDFNDFMNKLINDEFQDIMCKVQRVQRLKQLIDEYDKARSDLLKIMPDYCC